MKILRNLLAMVPVTITGGLLSFAMVHEAHGQWMSSTRSVDQLTAERRIVPSVYRTVGLDVPAMHQLLAAVGEGDPGSSPWSIELPRPEGGMERYRIVRTHVMHPVLGAQYPGIMTFSGVGMDQPAVQVRIDLTPHGFHAMVLDPLRGDVFIDPYAVAVTDLCIVYQRADLTKSHPAGHVHCSYHEVNDLHEAARRMEEVVESGGARVGDCQRRVYRLALACTGEYANYHGSNTTNNNKSFALAAMVTSMNRVNGIYERDLGVFMQLVANTDLLIYLNPSTDPYTNNNGGTMLGQNQTTCNSVIGSANYDIGHVFSTGGGGVAYLASVCTSNKAGGVTGGSNPVGDPFDIDYVAHEMGHQFGGNHTQNNDCNRVSAAAYETGSGVTIMGYAGVCSPNVQMNSDALFHAYSLQEMATFITGTTGNSCAQTTSSGNQPPTVSAGPDRTIPRSTPFILTATASDPDPGTELTYAWEQMNNQISTQPPSATSANGPNFRCLLPSTSPSRYLPNLNAVVANTTPTWEVLSSVGRTYNFRVTVRDNAVPTGCTEEDDMVVTVSGTTGPFAVSQPNTNVSWQAGSAQTVTWSVAGTNGSPVNCANVDILLSVDGGFTYPHTLLTATPNDGTQSVTIPLIPATTTARVMVRANGNIFYDISNTNFSITAAPSLSAKLVLEGPFVTGTGLMNDLLRQQGLLPLQEPYTALGWAQAGGGGNETTNASVLAVTGNNAIVDWVRVELRSPTDPSQIVATRQGLLQRDGDLVAGDGTSPLTFGVAAGNYHVAVRHRNHLGCMTASSVTLGGSPLQLDFRTPATATYGNEARKDMEGVAALWSGNVIADDRILYTGANNDRDPLLVAIGGTIPTATATGYLQGDINLDGLVKYTGDDNDRDPILANIGGTVPTAQRIEQLP